ncbi:MAG TPA: long-chain fatty acid--CoA ligase [Jatrophihabitans sp.]|jgi:long-chain acyl-CoA synthetase
MTAIGTDTDQIDQSVIDDRAATVARLFYDRVAATPTTEAFRFPEGDGWASATWSDVNVRVRSLAAGLIDLGIEAEERVALASATRYEWVLADLAVMCAGAATTTVYPSTTAADVAYIVADSGSRLVFADNMEQVDKLRAHRGEIPDVIAVVLFDDAASTKSDGAESTDGGWVIGLEELARRGDRLLAEQPGVLHDREAQIGPDSLATVIYTSGTTGRPKGVRLLHSSWTYEGATVDSLGTLHISDLQLLWLPLAHVFGKILLTVALQIGFATAVDGRIDKIVENLASVRPTFMGAAPRIFEKAYARVTSMVAAEGGAKAKIFSWGIGIGDRVARARRTGKAISPLIAAQHALADRLVLSKVRARFGGRLRFFISGSAPLNIEIAEWFDAVGITILEGYGLTETSAASFCNRPSNYVLGTVGRAYPGTEVRIAEDGEILLRGPGVMQGYHNQPEATAATLSQEGWFATGDIGELDDRGFLRITDRKKDLFKTSGGKYVAPTAIESTFKGICPLASQLVVYGAGRNFVSALITLDADAVSAWAASHDMSGGSYAEVVGSDQMNRTVQGYVDELNGRLNRWETIKRFVILDHDLTVEAGELTPSLKLKRRFVADKYAETLDQMYS